MKEVASTFRSQSPSVVQFASQRSLLYRLLSWLRSRFAIPYGYEDERGFHYGVEPTPSGRAEKSETPKVFTDRASHVIPSPCPVPLANTEVIDDEHRHSTKG